MSRPFLDTLAEYFDSPSGVAEEADRPTALVEFRHALQRVRAALPDIDLTPPAATLAGEILQRVSPLCRSYGGDGFEEEAARLYEDPRTFQRDVELVLALDRHPQLAASVLDMHAYAEAARIPDQPSVPPLHELQIDRRLLLQRLFRASEIREAHQIEEIEAAFDLFRRRYQETFLAHHESYRRWYASQAAQLDHDAGAVRALLLLNEVQALGAPVAVDLPARFEAQTASLIVCDSEAPLLESHLAQEPACASCGLQLSHVIPEDVVTQLRSELGRALRTQQQRLARAMVGRAVSEPSQPAFDRFLRALRAADLDPLIAVLDEPAVALIRDFLDDPPAS